MVSVPWGQIAEVERAYAVGQRVNLFADRRPDGWIRITELRRVSECGREVQYLLVFATCYPPAPPN
jgi:hypothetical protein